MPVVEDRADTTLGIVSVFCFILTQVSLYFVRDLRMFGQRVFLSVADIIGWGLSFMFAVRAGAATRYCAVCQHCWMIRVVCWGRKFSPDKAGAASADTGCAV